LKDVLQQAAHATDFTPRLEGRFHRRRVGGKPVAALGALGIAVGQQFLDGDGLAHG